MYAAKVALVFAAALFCLASPAVATTAKNGTATKHTFAGKNAPNQKLKAAGLGRGTLFPKGEVFSFFIDYAAIDGPIEVLPLGAGSPPPFKIALYEKNIYSTAAKTAVIGNALYNIQIFEETVGTGSNTGLAEGNYQSVQNIPLTDKKGAAKDVYININGRIQYTLAPGQQYYTGVRTAKILSIAVSSLETEGIACTNVGVNPITVSGSTVTEYIIDARKAVCVPQVISG